MTAESSFLRASALVFRWLNDGGWRRWAMVFGTPAAIGVFAVALSFLGVSPGLAVKAGAASAAVVLLLHRLFGLHWLVLAATVPPVAGVVLGGDLGGDRPVLGALVGLVAVLAPLLTIGLVVRRRSGSWAFLGDWRAAALNVARRDASRARRYAIKRSAHLRAVLSEQVRSLVRPVKILEKWMTVTGPTVVFRLPPGSALSHLTTAADQVATALGVARVIFEQENPLDASVIRARLMEWDPLRYSLPTKLNPWRSIRETGPLDPVPLGVDEMGEPVELVMKDGGFAVLIGGSPGSGKSIVHLFAAHGCLDASRKVFLIDLKGGVELQAWRPHATRFATNLAEATDALAEVDAEVGRRMALMSANGWREWSEAPDPSRLLVVIDEAAQLLRALDPSEKALSQACEAYLGRLVALGRAVGVQVVVSTQKPTADAIPTAIRDLMGTRICFRVGTRQQAEAVLGPDALARGADPMSIPVDAPGLGFIVAENGTVRRFRAHHASDGLVRQLAGIRRANP